jgi:hypothetical protein
MDYKFYSIRTLRKDGNPLLAALAFKEPEHFTNLAMRAGILPTPANMEFDICANEDVSGMLLMRVNGKVVCIVILLNESIDRIYTPVPFRNKGYASRTLGFLNLMSTYLEMGLCSPVRPSLVKMYERVGWEIRSKKANKDGTFKMSTTHWKPNKMYDASNWLSFLTEPVSVSPV